MYPTLADGQVVFVDPAAYDALAPVPGDIILVKHPYRSDVQMLKRVQRIETDGRLFLIGDNPLESFDSRGFGPVSVARVLGKVLG